MWQLGQPHPQMPSPRGRGKNSAPVSSWLPRVECVVTEGFVCGVGSYPGRGLPGRELAHEAILSSGYSDHCPSSTLYFRRPGLKQGHMEVPGCGSFLIWPHTGKRCQLLFQNPYQVLKTCLASVEGTTVHPPCLCLCFRKCWLGASCTMGSQRAVTGSTVIKWAPRPITGCNRQWTN